MKRIDSINPYDTISSIIQHDPSYMRGESYLVTIRIGSDTETVLLHCEDPETNYYLWDYDWWEGQKEIFLEGYIAISDIRILNENEDRKAMIKVVFLEGAEE